ncbi:FGGY-family carbohydrate kinase [Shimia sagamensis]|uniref:Sugar (Pentulose or hexulose) kinase n=1 Tax=Shimia sagamensis TaxID=1566352 RepID=A0ABY1NTF6_9RHOB|nr:FGGY-family carbohydrate kinase [Shimia sagamensis]SMP16480.1 Sugar (pentulose or hexulose) kinase [Shimia sagamensis]
MTTPPKNSRHIAVIDVGKTNAKLAMVDGATMTELAVVTRPNTVLAGPPYPHFDLDGHWAFFLENLAAFHAQHGVDAISVTTHGASIVLLDQDGALACPMLDYEHHGPDDLADTYDQIRPDFSETGSPRLPGGLNVGAQLHWLFDTDPTLLDRTKHIITYPQYWGYRLTGNLACDVTSLGCHTDLWNPLDGKPSSLVARLGVLEKLAPARQSSDILGDLDETVSLITGLSPDTPVVCGIHDSNASLVPYLNHGTQPISVVSTGTWVVCMTLGGAQAPQLDAQRDTLINVNALGQPVPSARFMGGREYEIIRNGSDATPTDQDRDLVHSNQIMLLPSVVTESGPFPGQRMQWTVPPETDGQRIYALSLYLALMTECCLELTAGGETTIVEGPFARNSDYLGMLNLLRAGHVEAALSQTGTSVGAAMLIDKPAKSASGFSSEKPQDQRLFSYAKKWFSAVNQR